MGQLHTETSSHWVGLKAPLDYLRFLLIFLIASLLCANVIELQM